MGVGTRIFETMANVEGRRSIVAGHEAKYQSSFLLGDRPLNDCVYEFVAYSLATSKGRDPHRKQFHFLVE